MQESDFWSEMRAAPEESLPRQAYADWLDEQGDARADLLRVSDQLATMDSEDAWFEELLFHEHELINTEGVEWLAPAFEWADGILFHRGMLIPELTPAEFIKTADRIGDVPFFGWQMKNTGTPEKLLSLSKLLRCEALSELRSLSQFNSRFVTKPADFLSSRHLDDLWSLNADALSLKSLYPSGADALPGLRRLVLHDEETHFGAESDYRIDPEFLSRLESLGAIGDRVPVHVLNAFQIQDVPTRLQRITLGSNATSKVDLSPLFDEEILPQLRHLRVLGYPMTGTALDRMFSSALSQQLVSLMLTFSLTTTESFPSRFALPSLRRLSLHDCRMNDQQWTDLLRSPLMNQLQTLSIEFDQRTQPNWSKLFAKLPALPNLQALHLIDCNFDANDIKAIFVPDRFPNLKRLRVGTIDVPAFNQLVRSELPSVTELAVDSSQAWRLDGDRERFPNGGLLQQLKGLRVRAPEGGLSIIGRCLMTAIPLHLERLRFESFNGYAGKLEVDLKRQMLESALPKTLRLLRVDSFTTMGGDLRREFARTFADALAAGEPPLSTSDPQVSMDW